MGVPSLLISLCSIKVQLAVSQGIAAAPIRHVVQVLQQRAFLVGAICKMVLGVWARAVATAEPRILHAVLALKQKASLARAILTQHQSLFKIWCQAQPTDVQIPSDFVLRDLTWASTLLTFASVTPWLNISRHRKH